MQTYRAAERVRRRIIIYRRRTSNDQRTNYKKRWQPLLHMNLYQDGIVLHCLTSSRRRLLHWINRLTCNNDPFVKNSAHFKYIHLLSACVFCVRCTSAVPSDSSSCDVRYALPYQIAVIYSGQTFCASQVLQDRTGLDLGFYVIFMLIRNLVDMWFWNACNLVPPVPCGILRVYKKSMLSKACVEG